MSFLWSGPTGFNFNRTTALERTGAYVTGGGLNAIYWYQIFALDSVVGKAQKCSALMDASLTCFYH